MENRISASEEKQLTRAIEKAATIASVNETMNRDTILSTCLQESNINKKFAKVASAAFNKRLTVLTFQKTADEHKADDFALSDADTVYTLMGGETLDKAASVKPAPFVFSVNKMDAPMSKAASAQPAKQLTPNYEDTVSYMKLRSHVEGMLEKHAAAFGKVLGIYNSASASIEKQATEVADYFNRTDCESFEFSTVKNAYGHLLQEAIGSRVSPTVSFNKTAAQVVVPKTGVYTKVAKLLQDIDDAKTTKRFIEYYKTGLDEFSKEAAALGNYIASCEYRGITKEAAEGPGGLLLAGMVAGPTALTLGGIQALDQARETITNATGDALANARAMYSAKDTSLSPSKVLDADFLIKDRYRDRLLGWSDIAADPSFANYPSEQVFAATQKAMDLDTSFERPDRREALRATVAQLLPQNNRLGMADVSQIATAIRGLESTQGTAGQAAVRAVGALTDKTAPAPVALTSVLSHTKATNTDTAKNIGDLFAKEVDEHKRTREKEREQARRDAERAADHARRDAEREADNERREAEREVDYNRRKTERLVEQANRSAERDADRQFKADEARKDRTNNADIANRKMQLESATRLRVSDNQMRAAKSHIRAIKALAKGDQDHRVNEVLRMLNAAKLDPVTGKPIINASIAKVLSSIYGTNAPRINRPPNRS